ncbi:MAG: hypothetical protein RLZZ282_373, partial [Verrucomicrobiota bacterium]
MKGNVRLVDEFTHDNEMNDRTTDLFTAALELAPGERAVFLTDACAGNAELRLEIEQLLADATAANDYFTGSFGAAAWAGERGPTGGGRVGDCAGPYRLLRQLGEGGFGVVWLAEQVEPIRRKVAVKVIKAGMDSREVLARFAAERQALARMGHPNIARVLEVGLTAAGHPFFAMEWVDGMPINRFCDDHGLSLGDRLQLFGDVCSAISHAHKQGVIHRDIKPSNVLVTWFDGKPLPKVIDFGIAKATTGRLFDGTLLTRTEQWIGTPGYMSPEQAGLGNVELDSRSDIYGLGVLLYELLTGLPPFGQTTLAGVGYDEMRRIIREVEPPRPSVRLRALPPAELAVIAGARKVSPTKLQRMINSDLDWIVLKAIEKSRDRRYGAAAELAEDLGRFLRNEPVSAKPPSPLYVIGKFAKRHQAAVRTACGFVVLLVVATVFSTRLALRATREERNRTNLAVISPAPPPVQAAFHTADPEAPVAAAKTSPNADPSGVAKTSPKAAPAATTALAHKAKPPSIQMETGWSPGSTSEYKEHVEPTGSPQGAPAAVIESLVPAPKSFTAMNQTISAVVFRGKRVRFDGEIMTQGVKNWAGFWLRADDKKGKIVAFQNMQKRGLEGTTAWKHEEIVLDIPDDAELMYFGMILDGAGKVKSSGLSLEIVDSSVPLTEPTSLEHAQSLRERAEAGSADAQYQLARADPHNWDFSDAYNHTKETQETISWIRKAAEQGHPEAQYHLANCYQYGKGVSMDSAESVTWYRKAAEQGVDNACLHIGFHYKDGSGVPKDAAEAAKWFRQGSKSDVYSLLALGRLYLKGDRGVPKDLVHALLCLDLTLARGVAECFKADVQKDRDS